jgi:recombination protein RecR
VGPKTALRYVYYLLKIPKNDVEVMARMLIALRTINVCDQCYTYSEKSPCSICADGKRDASVLCIVEEPRDIATIESTNAYQGRYLVLGGVLNPIDGITPDALRVRELLDRVKADEQIREIILALSPTIQGETTMMYLSKQLVPLGRRVTRLARGLPIGASLEYADEITLGDALKGRRDT